MALIEQMVFGYDWYVLYSENQPFVIGDKPILSIFDLYRDTSKNSMKQYHTLQYIYREELIKFGIGDTLHIDGFKLKYGQFMMPIAPNVAIYLKKNNSSIKSGQLNNNSKLKESSLIQTGLIDPTLMRTINFSMYYNSWEGIATNCFQTCIDLCQDMQNMLSQFTSKEIIDFRKSLESFTLN